MNSKTDKNFIYDYLIHLDSFLLHGVSEVGAPAQKVSSNNPPPKKSSLPPLCNKLSPLAFVNLNRYKAGEEKVFSAEESQLFNKIVVAMGLNPDDTYLTSLIKSESTVVDKDSIAFFTEELSQIASDYIVCFGAELANYFAKIKIEADDLQTSWQEISLFKRNIILVTIPSIKEMLVDPRHKKIAWAQLKKIADQLQAN